MIRLFNKISWKSWERENLKRPETNLNWTDRWTKIVAPCAPVPKLFSYQVWWTADSAVHDSWAAGHGGWGHHRRVHHQAQQHHQEGQRGGGGGEQEQEGGRRDDGVMSHSIWISEKKTELNFEWEPVESYLNMQTVKPKYTSTDLFVEFVK